MARARNIKPSFFQNEELGELSFECRLLFVGLWTLADREGRLEDRPKRIKVAVFPYDLVDVDPILNQLQEHDFILRYSVDGSQYIQVLNFVKHQDPHYKEKASEIPPPDGHSNYILATNVTRTQRVRILERDSYACQCCASTEALCIDHIIPVSRGGDSSDDNLQVLCNSCNTKKSNKLDGEVKAMKTNGKDMHKRHVHSNVGSNLNKENDASPSDSLIPDSLIPSSLIPESSDSVKTPESSPSKKITLRTWLAEIKLKGEKPISTYEPVFEYCKTVGLDQDWLQIAWIKFVERFTEDEKGKRKLYSDWRGVFLRAVRENWFSLWYMAKDGSGFCLTTVGVQADLETREAA